MWMSSHKHTSPLFFFDSLSLPTKERLAAMRGTAPGRHTDFECAPLRHKAPGSLSHGSNRQEFSSPGSPSRRVVPWGDVSSWVKGAERSEEHTSELQSRGHLVCRLLLEKKKK